MAIPMRMQLWRFLGLEYRPIFSWFGGETVVDQQFTLRGGIDHISALLGYRFLRAGDEGFRGPSLGLSVSY